MFEQNNRPIDWALWFQWIMATTVGWLLGRFLLPNLAFVVIGLALAVLQWLILQYRLKGSRWWLIATALGWTFGSVFIMVALPGVGDFTAGVIIGASTGFSQWLILRQEVYFSGWWIVINIVAWTTGLAFLPGILLTGVMPGAITGLALVLLLHYPKHMNDMER